MMNNQVKFKQVDVFTSEPYKGNPVAVVMNGEGMSKQQMQQIANWIHLSETTFICKPTDNKADYKLRIFTPQNELPFAGHPTIGSAWAVLSSGINQKNSDYLVQECGEGLVKINIENDQLFLTLPNAKINNISNELLESISNGLGISKSDIMLCENIDVGAVWITIQLKDQKEVISLKPNFTKLKKVIPNGITGVTVFGKSNNLKSDFEVRSFAPNEGVDEDPVCGSGNGCVATMVKEHQLINKNNYIATQGQILSRNGYVNVKFKNNNILVGGNAINCISGNIIMK